MLLVGVATAAAQLTGTAAPDFVLKSVAGQNTRLSEFRGEVVMLTFGATWCGDCRAQLDAASREMQTRYRDAGVELLAVSLDQTAKQAGELSREAARRSRCCTTPAARWAAIRRRARCPSSC